MVAGGWIFIYKTMNVIVCVVANVAWPQSQSCKGVSKIWLVYRYFFLLRKWFIYRYFNSHYENEIMLKNLLKIMLHL